MNIDVSDAARVLKVPQTSVRSWLARADIPFVQRLTRGRTRLLFTQQDMYGLMLLRDLTSFGVSVREAAEFSDRIIIEAGIPPGDIAAIVERGETHTMHVAPMYAASRFRYNAHLILPLRGLWNEATTGAARPPNTGSPINSI